MPKVFKYQFYELANIKKYIKTPLFEYLYVFCSALGAIQYINYVVQNRDFFESPSVSISSNVVYLKMVYKNYVVFGKWALPK